MRLGGEPPVHARKAFLLSRYALYGEFPLLFGFLLYGGIGNAYAFSDGGGAAVEKRQQAAAGEKQE